MKTAMATLVSVLFCSAALAQQVQIPTVQPCNFGKASGTANLWLSKRQDVNSAGTIDITVSNVACDPINGDGHPTGSINMRFSLSESQISDRR